MSGFSDSKRAALRDFEARYDESARVSSLLPHGALASTSAQHARSSSEGSTHRQRSVAAPAHPAQSHPMALSPYAHHGPFMPSPYGPPPMAPPFYPPGYGPVRFSAIYILSRAYRPFVSCVCEFYFLLQPPPHMWAGYGAMQGHAPVPSRRSRSPSRRRSGSRHSERQSPVRDEYDRPSGRSSRDRFVILPHVCSKHMLTCRLCRRFFRDVRDDFRPRGRFSRSSSPVSPPRQRRRTEREPMDPERKRLSILEQLERHYGRRAVQTSTPKRPDESPRKEASASSGKTSA